MKIKTDRQHHLLVIAPVYSINYKSKGCGHTQTWHWETKGTVNQSSLLRVKMQKLIPGKDNNYDNKTEIRLLDQPIEFKFDPTSITSYKHHIEGSKVVCVKTDSLMCSSGSLRGLTCKFMQYQGNFSTLSVRNALQGDHPELITLILWGESAYFD